MMNKRLGYFCVMLCIVAGSLVAVSSCKSCNKSADVKTSAPDTAASASIINSNTLNAPHADTSLAPVLSKILDEVFEASKNKDYNKLAGYIAYRGPDMKRMGNSVFNAKNPYERSVVRITAEVFNKWNSNIESRDYARVFALAQPNDSRNILVLEVIFVSRQAVNRKFFGFLPLTAPDDYKLVDITSSLEMP